MEVAASVVGLLAVGAQITRVLQDTIQGCIDAPQLARAINFEIQDFSYILSKLQAIVLGSTNLHLIATSEDINHLSRTLEGCALTLSQVEAEVGRLGDVSKLELRNRLRWTRGQLSLAPLILRIQSHKTSLMLILTILTRWVLLYLKQC